jgi:hypothetical protein
MKHMFLSAVMLGGVLWTASIAADTSPPADLNGREVVVRLYDDWRYIGAHFETIVLKTTGQQCRLDINDANRSQSVVVIPEDQHDMTIRDVLGNCVYTEPYRKGLRLDLARCGGNQRSRRWTFNDAMDNPIPSADTQIFLANFDDPNLIFRSVRLDESGRLQAPVSLGSRNHFRIVVSHPDYGTAVVVPNPFKQQRVFRLPLINADAAPVERTIWGTVTDPNGNPVPAALIDYGTVITPGKRSINASTHHKVVTDGQGSFVICFPVEDHVVIPPGSRVKLSVKAPREFDLLNYRGPVEPNRETTVVLKQGEYLREFVFKDENGPITDPDKLWYVGLDIRCTDRKWITITDTLYHYGWKDGKRLPLGTYKAYMFCGEKTYYFRPQEITAMSPKRLVFELMQPDEVLYQGQVVHGITGEPMPGAFVLATNKFLGGMAAITPEQWNSMHRICHRPSVNEPPLGPLRKICQFEKAIRTDQQGRFEVIVKSLQKHFKFVALEEDYLPVAFEKRHVEVDGNNVALVPTLRLYPAAKVAVTLTIDESRAEIFSKWQIGATGAPEWLADFGRYRKKSGIEFVQGRELARDIPQPIHVLAGVPVQIEFRARQRKGPRPCPITFEAFNALQGETIDLGKCAFEREIPIYVDLIDSVGEPLAGVQISHLDFRGLSLNQMRVTDPNGTARFMVPPYYEGRFAIADPGKSRKSAAHFVTYETNGPEDANTVYTIQLSDKMLEALFK